MKSTAILSAIIAALLTVLTYIQPAEAEVSAFLSGCDLSEQTIDVMYSKHSRYTINAFYTGECPAVLEDSNLSFKVRDRAADFGSSR